MNHEL